jgi:hypothetical protein
MEGLRLREARPDPTGEMLRTTRRFRANGRHHAVATRSVDHDRTSRFADDPFHVRVFRLSHP